MKISSINKILIYIKESIRYNKTFDIVIDNDGNIINRTAREYAEIKLSLQYVEIEQKQHYYLKINYLKASTSGSTLDMKHDFPRWTNSTMLFINYLFKKFKNQIIYLFDFGEEAPLLDFILSDLSFLARKHKILQKNIILTGPDVFAKYKIYNSDKNIIPFSYILKWNMINHIGIDLIANAENRFIDKKIKKYKSTCLFGRFDISRIKFILKLYDINYFSDDNLFSCFPPENETHEIEIKKQFDKSLKKTLGLTYSEEKIEDIINTCRIGKSIDIEDYFNPVKIEVPYDNDSYLWITSETNTKIHDIMFITEKTLKSYFWFKPMVLYSIPYTLDTLQKVGFIDVFELMGFDSSYDTEVDDELRLNMVVNQINKFNKKTKEELHKLYNKKEVQNALKHNNSLLMKLMKEKFIRWDDVMKKQISMAPIFLGQERLKYLIKNNINTNIKSDSFNGKLDKNFLKYFD